MRIGYEYVVVEDAAAVRTTIARKPTDYVEDNYSWTPASCRSREEFLQSPLFAPWVHEVHACYRRLLGDSGRVLSIGCGLGEHDVLLHLAGYQMTATDLIPGVASAAQQWFPDLTFGTLDALNDQQMAQHTADAVLITGLDYALDDGECDRLLANVAAVLSRSARTRPRLVFTVRYRDNLLTRVIDDVVLPLEARYRRRRKGAGRAIVKRPKGYRRAGVEIVRAAARRGFVHRSTCYAGFGNEFRRSGLLRRLPFLTAADKLLHVGCNCVVLAFDLVRTGAAA